MMAPEISTSPISPDLDRRRTTDLIPHILDYLAASDPDGLFAEYPISPVSYEKGYHGISYSTFANVVNGLAHWIRSTLGTPIQEYEVLAYIGPNDLRYPALVLAAVKAGYTLFLTSSRNSVPAQITMFDDLSCRTLLAPTPRPPQVQAIIDAHPVRIIDVPAIEDLLDQTFPHFAYEKVFLKELDRPMFIAHTSGSTGFPKPVTYTHASGITNTRLMSLTPPEGYKSVQGMFQGKRMFMTFPPFHAAYFVVSLFNCLPLGTIFLSPIAGAIPSAEGLVEGLKKSPADVAFIVPSIVLELAQNPEMLDYCSRNLEFLMYCGGDLPQDVGDRIASKIKLVNQYGATELGVCPELGFNTDYDPRDWKYVQFHPDAGYEFRPVVDNTYELHVVHNKNLEAQQPTFTLFPGITEYGSRDLFTPHPTKPGLWSWKARADDLIVFLNGEKTNPISMEQHIVARNPDVTAALVIGTRRFQAALLLELNMGKVLTVEERAAFIEKVWPSIEEANRECPAHAKVAKTHILFTIPNKPVLRAGKGTIQRAGTLAQYADEIDVLYADADKLAGFVDGESTPSVDVNDVSSLSNFVRDVFARATQQSIIDDQSNFFQLGLDSFQALLALRALRQSLKLSTIGLSTIYSHPSVATLVQALRKLVNTQYDSKTSDMLTRLAERDAILGEMQARLQKISPKTMRHGRLPSTLSVILTGSTGSLGSYILTRLLSELSVSHIYCLNRAPNSEKLQTTRNAARGLPTTFPEKRVTFLTANLTDRLLGLDQKTYDELQNQVNLIIHSAWPVNFNLPLTNFRPSLEGLISLVDFAIGGRHHPHLHFASSISSVMSSVTAEADTPVLIQERVIASPAEPLINGYGESKHIAELLLSQASTQFGLSVSFSRIGQVAGAIKEAGIWNPQEWFPSLILSSTHIRAIPQSLGGMDQIDWIPIDEVASILVELALRESQREGVDIDDTSEEKNMTGALHIFHLQHPEPTTWSALLPSVISSLDTRVAKKIDVVSPDVWVSLVRQAVERHVHPGADGKTAFTEEELLLHLKDNPAAKLLGFYEDVVDSRGDRLQAVILDVRETLEQSKKMQELERFQGSWIEKWVAEWMAHRD